MKKILLIGLCLAVSAFAQGQDSPMHNIHRKTPSYERPVNFGVKGGFTSSLFIISDFLVNGVPIEEVQNNYKIGYFGSAFMRINFERHFLQPEISYTINRCNITFRKPLPEDAPIGSIPSEAMITSSIHSIDIPKQPIDSKNNETTSKVKSERSKGEKRITSITRAEHQEKKLSRRFF